MKRTPLFLVASLAAAFIACGGDDAQPNQDTRPGGDAGPTLDGRGGLTITITSPAPGAADVDPTTVRFEASFSQALATGAVVRATLREGTAPRLLSYDVAEDRRSFSGEPVNLLRSGQTYTLKVTVDDLEASATFSTASSTDSTLDLTDTLFDVRTAELIHPPGLATVLGANVDNAAALLISILNFDSDTGDISLLVGVGDPDLAAGQTVIPAEKADATTPAFELAGRVEGRWLGIGPASLLLPLDGLLLTVDSFYLTGQLSTDGTTLEHLSFSGVLPVDVLSEVAGLDLSFLCTTEPFDQYCDGESALQVAFSLRGRQNQPIPFTAFITDPVSDSTDVEIDTAVDVYFSAAVDENATSITVTDESGAEVAGEVIFYGTSAVFTPSTPFSSLETYRVEVVATGLAGGADTRHCQFKTH